MGSPEFTVALLRASRDGLSGLAAARLAEQDARVLGIGGFEGWRAHYSSQLANLAAALEDEAPELFAANVTWSRVAFEAREVPAEALQTALGCLAHVLEADLPDAAWEPLQEYFRRAHVELEGAARPARGPMPAASPHAELVSRYLAAVTAGEERSAAALVLELLHAGRITPREAIEAVLLPVQREIGRRWHSGEENVGIEHFATQAARRLLVRILALSPVAPPRGTTVVVAAIAGDAHAIGVEVIAAFFELEGWRSICLGADTPIPDLVQVVASFQADLVALGATLDEHRPAVARAIEALRSARPGQHVIVGGAAFAGRQDLWVRVGADAFASTPAEALRLAQELVQTPPRQA